MNDIAKLADLMRNDWNRRIKHDFRFWMSDGYESDEVMWASGARDLEILTQGLTNTYGQTVLEIGSGIGRILKAALEKFGHVMGLDVSEQAIAKAKELIGQDPRLQLIHGNGYNLSEVSAESVDVVLSFAALCSIPTAIVGSYLREMWRVLKPNGKARIQLYVGKEQEVAENDTLHLRCYGRVNLTNALLAAGFEIESISELNLPTIQVSFKEMGIEAVIVGLKKSTRKPLEATQIAKVLLPKGENGITPESASDLEYWMSLNYASELAERGEMVKAKETLHYAANVSQTTAIDVGDLLDKIVRKIDQPKAAEPVVPQHVSVSTSGDATGKNHRIVKARFSEVMENLSAVQSSPGVQVANTSQGPVLTQDGQFLDHSDKPVSAAVNWVKRLLQEERIRKSPHLVVVGVGAGYHLDALVSQLEEQGLRPAISVFEPSAVVLQKALQIKDQARWLERITHLVVGAEVKLPNSSGAEFELVIRPQTQAVAAEYCQNIRAQFYGARGLSLLHPTIGVVGPMQGGGLPMVEYCSRALLSLHQRTRSFDLSEFYGSFKGVEKFIKEPLRRKGIENHFCEAVSQTVLESVNEKPVDIVLCLALAPMTPRILLELKARGIITVLWFVEDYVRFTYWKEIVKYFDFVFTIQKGRCIEAMKAAGAGEVHYVPVGCDPIVHAPIELTAEEKNTWGSPISFMGAGYHNRQQLFASLADMPLKIWGTEWPNCKPFDRMVQQDGRRLSPSEYVKIFNATDININLHSSHERDGVDPFGDFLNPRTFELACANAFQLVDERSLLGEAFEAGKELVTFKNAADLKEKIGYYLARPEERRVISERARKRALGQHTYGHRIQQMLSIIYSSRYEQLKAREDQSPWKRTLKRAKRHPELLERCERAFRRGEDANLDGLVSDIVMGQGKLSETEQKLMFLYHVKKQIIRMTREESGG